jgi:hypothetical protein
MSCCLLVQSGVLEGIRVYSLGPLSPDCGGGLHGIQKLAAFGGIGASEWFCRNQRE